MCIRCVQEAFITGVHKHTQAGIVCQSRGKSGESDPLAVSIVMSGGYKDNEDHGDEFWYTGQGGNDYRGSKGQMVHQQLVSGNLGLVNACKEKVAVRVLRGNLAEGSDVKEYIYDGLYDVAEYKTETGNDGFRVFRYRMVRCPNQRARDSKAVVFRQMEKGHMAPLLSTQLRALEASPSLSLLDGPRAPRTFRTSRTKVTKRVSAATPLLNDFSQGVEPTPIPVFNTVDPPELPESITYVPAMDYLTVAAPFGPLCEPEVCCDCTDGCLDPQKCPCVAILGGILSRNGTLKHVPENRILLECGAKCKCVHGNRREETTAWGAAGEANGRGVSGVRQPKGGLQDRRQLAGSQCFNRVTQGGVRVALQLFKTQSKGWGVRAAERIPEHTFVCEYVGQLMGSEEADGLVGEDEYIFDLISQVDAHETGPGDTEPPPPAWPSAPITPELGRPNSDAQGPGQPGLIATGSRGGVGCSPGSQAARATWAESGAPGAREGTGNREGKREGEDNNGGSAAPALPLGASQPQAGSLDNTSVPTPPLAASPQGPAASCPAKLSLPKEDFATQEGIPGKGAQNDGRTLTRGHLQLSPHQVYLHASSVCLASNF